MTWKRRHFLQLFGSTLATLGLSQTRFFTQANRYGRVLAQSTPRKLALLVGINAYPEVSDLRGCLNDVDLQYHLLVHRFGFHPDDIVRVWDNAADPTLKPSRDNILRAFQEHLIAQAKPGDVVVFHYSGHGSRVIDPDPVRVAACGDNQLEGLNGTLVPNDPMDVNQSGPDVVVPDIMGRSLFLLTHALDTENVTMVLDSCYSGAGTRGNVTVRTVGSRLSRSGDRLVASEAELEFQKKLMADHNLTLEDFQKERGLGIARGVALGSASCNQEALDAVFGDNFNAGAFSYLLTRYLWQLPASQSFTTVQANLRRSTYAEAELRGYDQEPVLEVKPGSDYSSQPFYVLSNLSTPPADGVITNVSEDGTIEFWLGGTATQTLTSVNTVFTVRTAAGETLTDGDGEAIALQKTTLTGNPIVGRGKLLTGELSQVSKGMFLQERIVGLPPNPQLVVGVDPSLGAETETAIAALESALETTTAAGQSVRRIRPVVFDQQQPVDYILARVNDALRQSVDLEDPSTIQADWPSDEVVALFTPTLAFVARTDGSHGEPVTAAVNRLIPAFKTLLASKVLRAIAHTSSELQVTGEIFSASRPDGGPRIAITSRALDGATGGDRGDAPLRPFTDGDVMQLEVSNQEERPLFVSCLLVNSRGEVAVLHPAHWDAPEDASRIGAKESLVIPRQEDDVRVTLQGSGFLEVITLVSTEPLRNALRGLQTIARGQGRSRGEVRTSDGDPVSLIDALLGDVDSASRGGGVTADYEISSTSGSRAVDSRAIAAFTTVLEVRS
ncbi:MAG: caspase family protein [Synechococcales bacterium]|nr:caspase family protein [Synechococcales bacterium]